MKRWNKMITVLCMLCLLAGLTLPASTSAVFDPGAKGSLTVTILDTKTKEPVPGGKIWIYCVAECSDDGLVYQLTDSFASCGLDLDSLDGMSAADNQEAAASLVKFISENKLTALAAATPDRNGTVKFTDAKVGLYLVVQGTAAPGYKAIAPFLITIPRYDEANETWIYEVNASPKVGTADPKPSTPPDASTPSTPPDAPTPSTPPDASTPTPPTPTTPPQEDGKLPQTGQLWWPAGLLAVAGVMSIGIGIVRRKRSTNE